MPRIAIIGSGFVGELTGKGFEELGHQILWYDTKTERIDQLKRIGTASTDIMDIVPYSDACFICVPTPTLGYGQDLSCVFDATRAVGRALKERQGPYLVVNRSTILPGVTRDVIIPNLEETSEKKVGENILFCHNPEFSTQISGTWTNNENFQRGFIDSRIVIGEFDRRSGNLLEKLYKPSGIDIRRMGLESAELLKYASNVALASRISYWNQMFLLAEKLGLDGNEIADIVGMDPRIGKYGTVCGMAYGGSCLPKDTRALIGYCQEKGIEPLELLSSINTINDFMREMYGIRE